MGHSDRISKHTDFANHRFSKGGENTLKRSLDRRKFLTAAAGLGGAMLVGSSRVALGYSANQRIGLAIIGHMYVASHFFSSIHIYDDVELVALCNPDRRKIPEVFQTWEAQRKKLAESTGPEHSKAEVYSRLLAERPPVYSDFRKMLEAQHKQIDALVVSMFDHYHGPACGTAMRMGKHVFCERPLGLTIYESRQLRNLAETHKVATSIRNPGNASGQFRRGVELIRNGVIGPVEQVHVWFDRGGPDLDKPPQGEEPIPEGLDWDAWLGPAAWRPFHSQWMSYAFWREFSNGGVGTFGPHAANLAFMALNVAELWNAKPDQPPTIKVQAECSRINRLSFPRWEVVRWHVPARGNMPPVQFTWYHGPGLSPGARDKLLGLLAGYGIARQEGEKMLGSAGALIIGRDGAIASDDHNVKITLLPREKFKGVATEQPEKIPPSRGHYFDWFHACRGGELPLANFSYAAPLSEFLKLANIATQLKGPLEYNPSAGQFVGNEQANALLHYKYRDGWKM